MDAAEMGEKVAAHDATLDQMNTRLGGIERLLDGIEARLSRVERCTLYVGGALGLLMTVYRFV
jgi:hypothetical protein